MKLIQTITNMVEVAQRNGNSDRANYEIEVFGNKTNLYHYGTLTASIVAGKVTHLYGQSVSDVDSINTFLEANGINGYWFSYRPVNGGFMVSKDGDDPKTLDQFNKDNDLH